MVSRHELASLVGHMKERGLDFSSILNVSTTISVQDAVRALAEFCAWIFNEDLSFVWLKIAEEPQTATPSRTRLPADCRLARSIPVAHVLKLSAHLTECLDIKHSATQSLIALVANAKRPRPRSNLPGAAVDLSDFQLYLYHLCAQGLEFKNLQAVFEEEADSLRNRTARLSVQTQKQVAAHTLAQERLAEARGRLNCGDVSAQLKQLQSQRDAAQAALAESQKELKRLQAALSAIDVKKGATEVELVKVEEQIRQATTLHERYRQRCDQNPDSLQTTYDQLRRDKTAVYERDAQRAHGNLEVVRTIAGALKGVEESMDKIALALTRRQETELRVIELGRRKKSLKQEEENMIREHNKFLQNRETEQKAREEQKSNLMQRHQQAKRKLEEMKQKMEALESNEMENELETLAHRLNETKAAELRIMRLEREAQVEYDETVGYLDAEIEQLPKCIDMFHAMTRDYRKGLVSDIRMAHETAVQLLRSFLGDAKTADAMQVKISA